VPAVEENGTRLFESGAIVLSIARRSTVLMPADPDGRARTEAWMFAALNSVEPAFANLAEIDVFHPGERWAAERRPGAVAAVERKLTLLAAWLGERPYLEDVFSAGDLLMATVLRILDHTDLVAQHPNLRAYRDRCTDRPAFQKALADQLESFQATPPAA